MCSVITTPIEVVIAPLLLGARGGTSTGPVSKAAAIAKRIEFTRFQSRGASPQPNKTHLSLLHRLVAIETANAIEGGRLVAFGEGWVVEDGVDEVVNGTAQDHDRLADVNQFSCALADDVNAEDLAGVAMENELEAASGIATNLASPSLA